MNERVSPLTRLKPYPAYKDSGVEWLGEIPAHWEVKRLKTFATAQLSNVDKKSVEGQELVRLCNYTDVYYNEQITPDIEFMSATATREQVSRFSLRAGDVLITKDSESWTDIAVPAVVTEDLPDVLCGYHLAHIRPGNASFGAFLSRAFSAIGPRDQFQVAANGITRFGLGGDAIRTGLFAMPSEPEQRAIAAFLDREAARIDTLVAKNARLIALLQEKRTAVITRAVTKGLDSTVPMKDSGVEWLGEIPAHWKLARLGRLAAIGNGSTPSREDPRYWVDGSHPWLTSGKINEELIAGADEFVTGVALHEYHLPLVPAGSALIAITGEGQTRGRAALLAIDSTINQHLAYVTPQDPRLLAAYLRRAFQCLYEWLRFESSGTGSTRAALTCEFLKAIQVVLPSAVEQSAIAAFLDRETAKLDALTTKVREAIDHLKELRTALISAAVTGKIDVCQPPAPNPTGASHAGEQVPRA